ncbi:hypothetical protein KP509_23G016900 [Ceratopteris richardii]|nr:hypothetical protein KP509_23G016900 [Ceratopteris richardii]
MLENCNGSLYGSSRVSSRTFSGREDAYFYGNVPAQTSSSRRPRQGFWSFLHVGGLCTGNEASEMSRTGRRRRRRRPFFGTMNQSSGLVPHSGSLILPIGDHSGPLNNIRRPKASVLVRASSIIPNNVISDRISTILRDPSSPKVTCFGRIQQQKVRRGAATPKSSLGNNIGEKAKPPASRVVRMKRGGKIQDGEPSVLQEGIAEGKERKKHGLPSKESIERLFDAQKLESDETHRSDRNEQDAAEVALPESEVVVNLSRFGTATTVQPCKQTYENESKSLASNPQINNGFGQCAAPCNALLLMRNSKVRDISMLEGVEDLLVVQIPPPNALLLMKNSMSKGKSRRGSLSCGSIRLHSASFAQAKKPVHRQSSLPDEKPSIWQRRAIAKPSDLHIR